MLTCLHRLKLIRRKLYTLKDGTLYFIEHQVFNTCKFPDKYDGKCWLLNFFFRLIYTCAIVSTNCDAQCGVKD